MALAGTIKSLPFGTIGTGEFIMPQGARGDANLAQSHGGLSGRDGGTVGPQHPMFVP